MLRKIKFILKYFFFHERVRLYNQSFNPFTIDFGANSYIDTPLQIDGGRFIKIGDNTSIGKNAWLSAFERYNNQKFNPSITIENNVHIGNYSCITCINGIIIEEGCLFSEYVYISDHAHGYDPSINLRLADQDLVSKGKTVIGQNTFIGFRASIMPGVKLGRNCVVGAHSVVTKSFPEYSMVAGVPAKIIKTYCFEKKQWIKA